MNHLPKLNRQTFNLYAALNWFIVGAIAIYILLFAYNSAKHNLSAKNYR